MAVCKVMSYKANVGRTGRGRFLNFQIDRHFNRPAILSCNAESLIWIEHVMKDCLEDTVKIYHIRVFDVLKIKRNCNHS